MTLTTPFLVVKTKNRPLSDQWEREETVDRVRASVAIRAKLGSPLGGPAPFGYQWKDKKLTVDPKEAPVRKLMYELFLKHRRKKTVVRLLNEAGHRTRNGSQFTSKTVTRLIQDPTGKGIQRSNHTTRNGQTKQCIAKPEQEWFMHKVDAIVSVELWDQCNAIIDQSHEQNRRPAQKPVHTFAGLAFCECGEKMYVPSNSPKYVCRVCRNKIPIVDLDAIFAEEIKDFAYSPEQISAYLTSADQNVAEKERLLAIQKAELDKARGEITRVYKLYQEGQIDTEGFGKFYKPLDERQKQLETAIPRLEAEIDISKVYNLSTEHVAIEAQNLSSNWSKLAPDDKRSIVEAITERITIGKGEIDITPCCLPPTKEMSKGWRKGWFMRPFCHLVIKAIRVDSHPLIHEGILLSQALTTYRTRLDLTQSACALRLRVSKRTLENWERGRTKPTKKLWANLKSVISFKDQHSLDSHI